MEKNELFESKRLNAMISVTVYRFKIRDTLIITGLLQQQVNWTRPDRHRTVAV